MVIGLVHVDAWFAVTNHEARRGGLEQVEMIIICVTAYSFLMARVWRGRVHVRGREGVDKIFGAVHGSSLCVKS